MHYGGCSKVRGRLRRPHQSAPKCSGSAQPASAAHLRRRLSHAPRRTWPRHARRGHRQREEQWMSRGARGPGAWSKCRHTARSSPGLPQSAAQELAAPPLSLRSAVSEGYGPAVLRARFHQIHHLRDPYRRSRPPRRPCPLARSPAPGQSGQPRQRPAAAATDRKACRRRRPPAASRAAAPRKARPRPRPPRRSQRALGEGEHTRPCRALREPPVPSPSPRAFNCKADGRFLQARIAAAPRDWPVAWLTAAHMRSAGSAAGLVRPRR